MQAETHSGVHSIGTHTCTVTYNTLEMVKGYAPRKSGLISGISSPKGIYVYILYSPVPTSFWSKDVESYCMH